MRCPITIFIKNNFFYIYLFYRVFDHILTVSSLDADAIKFPIGFIAISFIAFLCPINLNGRVFGLKFQTNIFPSSLPDIACCLIYFFFLFFYIFLFYMFGLKIHDVIVSVFPLNERYKTGSEKRDWGSGWVFIFLNYIYF